MLRATTRSYSSRPWTAADTLVFAKVMAWDLSGNLDSEIERAVLAGLMPVAEVEEMYPDYPEGSPVIAPTDLQIGAPPAATPAAAIAIPALAELRSSFSQLDRLIGARGAGIGSNNWAISGRPQLNRPAASGQ